ncbi:MAG: hypothetical protein ACI8PB_003380 [Desulforhopalus sp.]
MSRKNPFFSTFLASSTVQDGHGALPLLAESRGEFFKVKTISFLVGILVGSVGYASGWWGDLARLLLFQNMSDFEMQIVALVSG